MKKYILTAFFAVCCFGSAAIWAQQQDTIKITGNVLDAADRTPLLGAKIYSADLRHSAMTAEDGSFSLPLPAYIKQVYVSAPDYSAVLYPLQRKTEVEVLLYPSVFSGYYQGVENLNSQNTATVRGVQAISADAEIQTLLGGDVRTIIHSGTPAIGAAMFIRGLNSLNAGSQPLILLDGIVFDNQYDRASIHDGFLLNPLANISVDDIETVTVIKDGTSLYGSKGANGVLSITTKRGRSQATTITASALFGYNQQPKTIPMLNANQFRVYVSDLLKDGVSNPSYLNSIPFLNEDPNYFDYLRYHNDNNWSRDVYRNNSTTQSYNVGVSGGDNVALYNLSMGYAGAGSTLKANGFNRFNARFNSDIDLGQLKFAFDLAYSQTDRTMRNDGLSEDPNSLLLSPSVIALIKAPFLIPYEYTNVGKISPDLSDADYFGVANPVAIIENGVGKSSQNYLALTVRPTFHFNRHLKIDGSVSYQMNSLFESYFRPYEGVGEIELPDVGGVSRRHAKGQNSKQITLAAALGLNWNKRYEQHAFDLSGGLRFYSDTYKGEYGSGHNSASDLDQNLGKGLAYRQTLGYDDAWRSFSWFAQANYSLYEKYLLSLAAAVDASSRFGKDADLAFRFGGVPWAVFPSANAAWLVSSEDFMKNVSFVNMLKIRVGYGLSGNDNLPNAKALTYFSSFRYINEYTGKVLANIGNTSLRPETSAKANLGIDANLLKNRLSLSANLFQSTTSNLLTMKQLPYIAGQDYYWTNEGKLKNSGFEIAVNAKVLNLKNFKWEVGASVSHYKNQITELPDGDYTTQVFSGEILSAVGKPAGVFYGYKTKGVFATSQEAAAANLKVLDRTGADYRTFGAGDVHFEDINPGTPDGFIDEKDKTVIGDPNPDFFGAFNTTFAYKKLSVSALFTFSYGNDVYNYMRSQLEGGYDLRNQTAALQNRWVNEGQQTSVPKITYRDPLGNSRFSDRWIEDGSYLRFKTLSVAYQVPVNSIFLSGFTVSLSANNLLTFTKYLGADPEFSIANSVFYQGIDAGWLAQGRSYFVGLKLNL